MKEFRLGRKSLCHVCRYMWGLYSGVPLYKYWCCFDELTADLSKQYATLLLLNSRFINTTVGHHCPDVIIPTCAHVSGSSLLFPPTPLAPSTCVASTPSSTPGLNGGNPIETHAKIHAHHEIASYGWGAAPYCPRGPIAHTVFKSMCNWILI